MKVYCSGPMRNHPKHNFAAFDALRDKLVDLGHQVISPADMDRASGFHATDHDGYDFDIRKALQRDIDAMLSCEAVVLMRGWETSKGATAEVAYARCVGMRILDADTLEDSKATVIATQMYRNWFDKVGAAY